jgi:hypothetical protein
MGAKKYEINTRGVWASGFHLLRPVLAWLSTRFETHNLFIYIIFNYFGRGGGCGYNPRITKTADTE